MRPTKPFKIYTEQESFLTNPGKEFFINSYKDEEPDILNRVEPHRHTYYEIIWARCGEGVHTIDFVDYKFTGPCLFLLHPQNIHTIKKRRRQPAGLLNLPLQFLLLVMPISCCGTVFLMILIYCRLST